MEAAAAVAEKMAALKKVYADIMLNMAKESAARVLAAERRAAIARRAVAAAKEEAAAVLVRVKSVMDAKVREAETASIGQLRKIGELESQLNVAEHTICSLRAELKRSNNELAKVKTTSKSFIGQIINGRTTRVSKILERNLSSDSVLCAPDGSGHVTTSDSNTTLSPRTSDLEQNISTVTIAIQKVDPEPEETVKHGIRFGNGSITFPRNTPRKRRGKRSHIKSIDWHTIPDHEMPHPKPSDTVSHRRPEDAKTSVGVSCRQSVDDIMTENAGKTPQERVSFLMGPDRNVPENYDSLLCETNLETCDDLHIDLGIKNEKVSTGTVLKYTFQRKRKRVSANNNEENFLLQEKTVDHRSALSEPHNPSLTLEFDRKDRRLVQVARQLVLLSERRW